MQHCPSCIDLHCIDLHEVKKTRKVCDILYLIVYSYYNIKLSYVYTQQLFY